METTRTPEGWTNRPREALFDKPRLGGSVEVFSQSSDGWLQALAVNRYPNGIRVEYQTREGDASEDLKVADRGDQASLEWIFSEIRLFKVRISFRKDIPPPRDCAP